MFWFYVTNDIKYCGEFDNWGAIMSVSAELLCSFELLKPLDSSALKSHIKKGRNKRQSMLNSPVSFTRYSILRLLLILVSLLSFPHKVISQHNKFLFDNGMIFEHYIDDMVISPEQCLHISSHSF